MDAALAAGTVAVWLLISISLLVWRGPAASLDGRIVASSSAGSAARAEEVLAGASLDALRVALRWDLLLVADVRGGPARRPGAVPVPGLPPPGLAELRRAAVLILVWAAGLDVVENLLLLAADRSGPSPDALWVAVATAAWAKFLGLGPGARRTWSNAALVYALTPRSVQGLLVGAADGAVEDASRSKSWPAADGRFRQGICIAGGGVRSAALALGGLQELETGAAGSAAPQAAPSWDAAERMTAVSGGAYMAGAWSVARSARRSSPAGRGRARPPPGTMGEGLPGGAAPADPAGLLAGREPDRQAEARRSDVPGVLSRTCPGWR